MTSSKLTSEVVTDCDEVHQRISPSAGIQVTADVQVIQYDSNFGNNDGPKCKIITNLSAFFNESPVEKPRIEIENKETKAEDGHEKNEKTESQKETEIIKTVEEKIYHYELHKSKDMTCNVPTLLSIEESIESMDQPFVRRSKKNTQLNKTPLENFASQKRVQIERIKLLPYLGCRRPEFFKPTRENTFMKLSKSLDMISNYKERRTPRLIRSQILTTVPKYRSTRPTSSNKTSIYVDSYLYSDGEYELPYTSDLNDYRQEPTFSLNSNDIEIQLPEICSEKKREYNERRKSGNEVHGTSEEANKLVSKGVLMKGTVKLDKENNTVPSKFSKNVTIKYTSTRNVSVLHRPHTRDKSTSTSSLDKILAKRDLDSSIKGLLMPYIENGRDFPSEITLQLIPKKEALLSIAKDEQEDLNLADTSENLLAPILNTDTKKKKKKKRGGFLGCFSNKKDKNYDESSNSDTASNKEIYFPSVVEVKHKKIHTSVKEGESKIFPRDSSTCSKCSSDFNGRKKKKR